MHYPIAQTINQMFFTCILSYVLNCMAKLYHFMYNVINVLCFIEMGQKSIR